MKNADTRHVTRLLLGAIGVLLFAVGILVGQQTQRSKLDKYLQPTSVTSMQLALIDAQLDRIRDTMGNESGIRVPEIYYDAKTHSIRAYTLVFDELTKQPLAKARQTLFARAAATFFDVQVRIPEVSKEDFIMTFKDFSTDAIKSGGGKDFAEYVNGDLVFK
jgi:hypothetical protein